MPRHKLTIAYDGSAFHGWQRQFVGDAPEDGAAAGERAELRTVQREVQRAVREVVREPVSVQGASRTDAGVHAKGQVASFTCSDDRRGAPEDRLALAINARLPGDALVVACERVRDDFDPIGGCVSKGYRYTLHTGALRPLWDRSRVHHVWRPLDLAAMRAGAALLVGRHDFAGFAAAGHGRLSTVRTIHACEVVEAGDERVGIDVSGDGFLYNMVRIIAGTLVEIGRGRRAPESVSRALESLDRRDAGPTLPPGGLCLEWIRYRDDVGG